MKSLSVSLLKASALMNSIKASSFSMDFRAISMSIAPAWIATVS